MRYNLMVPSQDAVASTHVDTDPDSFATATWTAYFVWSRRVLTTFPVVLFSSSNCPDIVVRAVRPGRGAEDKMGLSLSCEEVTTL